MLIEEAERPWAPDRHSLFTPEDRRAVVELLKVGKRLELQGAGIHVQSLWPTVLSFCGRGWFQSSDEEESDGDEGGEGSEHELSDGDDGNDEMEYGFADTVPSVEPSSSVDDESLTLPTF
jgi:hypothetical protein